METSKIPYNRENNIEIIRWEPSVNNQQPMPIHQPGHTNLAHCLQWFTIIKNAYGHLPCYLRGEDIEGQSAILPAFFIRSRLFGTVVTSMPFLDVGGPCSSSPQMSLALVDALLKEAVQLKASTVELRCTEELALSIPPSKDKVNLTLSLPSTPDKLWRQLNAKIRNQVRKAERSGLTVEFGGVEKLADFYEPFVVNMRDLGSPVHSRKFFSTLFTAFEDKARVAVVRKGSMPIGGLIALAFEDTLVVPWASCMREYFSLCPNMILYWETLRSACMEGFLRFDFGRSSCDSNTYRFKRQWGALEEPLFWYTIPIGAGRSGQMVSDHKRKALFAHIWQRLPLRVTRWLGPHIRKYVTL